MSNHQKRFNLKLHKYGQNPDMLSHFEHKGFKKSFVFSIWGYTNTDTVCGSIICGCSLRRYSGVVCGQVETGTAFRKMEGLCQPNPLALQSLDIFLIQLDITKRPLVLWPPYLCNYTLQCAPKVLVFLLKMIIIYKKNNTCNNINTLTLNKQKHWDI